MKIVLLSCALLAATVQAGFSNSGWESSGWQASAPAAWPSMQSGGWQEAPAMAWPANVAEGWHFGSGDVGGHADIDMHSNQEDENALSAVGLARLLGGGASHAHQGMFAGHKYTISGPTQKINTFHKIQLDHPGGHVLHRTQGTQLKKIIFVQPPNSHGWQ